MFSLCGRWRNDRRPRSEPVPHACASFSSIVKTMENGNGPATKQDIERLDAKLDAKIEQLDTKIEQLRSEMNHGYRDLVERLDDGITRMLTAFYGVAETHGKRLNEIDASEVAIRSRLSTVETRLLELEKRVYIPPQTH